MEALSCVQKVPDSLREKVLLENGTLFVSMELKGDPVFVSYVGLAQRHGVMDIKWVDAREFREKYAIFTDSANTSTSEMISLATSLIQQVYDEGGSDIHLWEAGSYGLVQFRRLGLIKDHSQFRSEKMHQLITCIYQSLVQGADSTFSPTERQDGRIGDRKFLPPGVHSVRVHTEPLECAEAQGGTGMFMTLRLLYDRTKASGSMEDRVKMLGYDEQDALKFRFLTQRTGLTIISGPTGHGKSTLLKHIMEGQAEAVPEKSYMSIEDPPEYPIANVKQILVSTKAVTDPTARGRAYMEAIAGAMRSDPDVIMIGEIRYPEAAAASIDAALTGHGVLATLHANNGFGIIRRMVSLLNAARYADPLEYLCDPNVMAGLVYQRLLPLHCPHCKVPLADLFKEGNKEQRLKVLPDPALKRLMSVLGDDLDGVYVRGEGCPQCKQLGIVGQTVAAEVIVTDQTMLAHLRKGEYDKAKTYWLNELNGRTYVQHATSLIRDGLVDPHLAELRLGVPLDFDKVSESLKITNRSKTGGDAA